MLLRFRCRGKLGKSLNLANPCVANPTNPNFFLSMSTAENAEPAANAADRRDEERAGSPRVAQPMVVMQPSTGDPPSSAQAQASDDPPDPGLATSSAASPSSLPPEMVDVLDVRAPRILRSHPDACRPCGLVSASHSLRCWVRRRCLRCGCCLALCLHAGVEAVSVRLGEDQAALRRGRRQACRSRRPRRRLRLLGLPVDGLWWGAARGSIPVHNVQRVCWRRVGLGQLVVTRVEDHARQVNPHLARCHAPSRRGQGFGRVDSHGLSRRL